MNLTTLGQHIITVESGKIPDCAGQFFYQNSSKSFWDKPYTIIEKTV